MSDYKYSDASDELLADEFQSYKPVSPSATLALLTSIAAVIAAITVADVGWAFLAVPVVGLLLGQRAIGSIKKYDMAGKPAARAALVLSALSLVGGSAYYVYYLKTVVPPGYQVVEYKVLNDSMPESPGPELKAIDGQKIYIKGYVYPTEEMSRSKNGVTSFVLCRDNGTCCFGGQPKLKDMVSVKLKNPLKLHYTSSEHGVGGTFRVAAEQGEGKLGTIVYHIDDADVLH